jgi:hypothetical protein
MKQCNTKSSRPLLAVLVALSLLFIGSAFESSHAEPVRISVSSTDLAYLATAIAGSGDFLPMKG